MDNQEAVEARGAAIIAALQEVLHTHGDPEQPGDRGLVTDYAVVIEMVGDDGDPYLRIMTNPASTSWRSLGLLDAAHTQKRYDFTSQDDN